jgi:UDP-3-O-[3-hydroxymyristoyl] glucosamine N-acyltransferase
VRTSLPLEGVFVHPYGLCESDEVGPGTRVWAFAHVLAGARIGRDCNVCDGAFMENGASVGDRVTVPESSSPMTCARAHTSNATEPSCR